MRVGEIPEKCSEDRAAASALPSSEDLTRGIWVSAGREELARRRGGEEYALPEREKSTCKGPGVLPEPEV